MHGHKREEYKARFQDPKVAAGLAHKAQQWYALNHELLQRRDEKTNNTDTDSTLILLEKALLVNPDPYHLWTFRRELLLSLSLSQPAALTNINNIDNNDNDKNSQTKATAAVLLSQELKLTQGSLQRNPKSYGAWFHRKWAIQQYGAGDVQMLNMELALSAQFLKLDERNFHCWSYRRFIVAAIGNFHLLLFNKKHINDSLSKKTTIDGSWDDFLNYISDDDQSTINIKMGAQIVTLSDTNNDIDNIPDNKANIKLKQKEELQALLQSEWKFTSDKIADNFSNFSAFHYRSQLYPFLSTNSVNFQDFMEQELQLVENAMCTEPDDQTAWWYHAFLLEQLQQQQQQQNNDTQLLSVFKDRLMEQVDLLQELLQDCPNSKWVLLGLHTLLHSLNVNPAEQKDLLEKLIQVDPDRKVRYQLLLKQKVEMK